MGKFRFTNWWTFFKKGDKKFSFDLFSIFIDRKKVKIWNNRSFRITIFNFEFEWKFE